MIRRSLFSALAAALCFACSQGAGGVTRMVDGVRYEGRFINPEAYAAYLLGVQREARGDFKGALSAYREAHAEDPDSPEVWARIGAVRCVSKDPAGASSAFERGIDRDPEYYGNYFERARCAERSRNLQAALTDGMSAVRLRPQDEAANLLVSRVLQALGRAADGRAWLEAFTSFHDGTLESERALQSARGTTPSTAPSIATEGPSHSSAFRELRSGHYEQARKQAERELGADPSNADAWVALLVVCDAQHDDACYDSTLSALRNPSVPPSDTAFGYLRSLLARRAGVSAATF